MQSIMMFLTLRTSVIIFGFIKLASARVNPLIIGGGLASIEVYPHIAYLIIVYHNKNGQESKIGCGASILDQFILLTAAHCVEDVIIENGDHISTIVGYSNVTGREKHPVSAFKIHENYNKDKAISAGDIALLRMAYPLELTHNVKRVSIMRSPPYYGPASIAGWGSTDLNNTHTDHVKHLRGLEVWSREECVERFQHVFKKKKTLPEGTLCAGYTYYPEGTIYSGDSGSALLVKDYIQIGLVSADLKQTIFLYTDVGYYYDWIEKTAFYLYCKNCTDGISDNCLI